MSLFNSSSLPSSASQWQETLGFVPSPAAKAGATPKKVAFLKMVREANPSVDNSFVQKVLQEQISEICFELKPRVINWLSRELGNQFLTLCTKEVRESTRTFAIYSLNQISEEVLSEITIKGKKKRFRDWRDIVFTTVLETPVVEYKCLVFVPEGYKLINSNHELLRAADQFGNCSFRLSGTKEFIAGTQGIIVTTQDPNPVMIHFVKDWKGPLSFKEMKHKDNVCPSSVVEKFHKQTLNEQWFAEFERKKEIERKEREEKRRMEKEKEQKEREKEIEREKRIERKETIKQTLNFMFCCLFFVTFLSTASVGFFSIVYRDNIEQQHK